GTRRSARTAIAKVKLGFLRQTLRIKAHRMPVFQLRDEDADLGRSVHHDRAGKCLPGAVRFERLAHSVDEAAATTRAVVRDELERTPTAVGLLLPERDLLAIACPDFAVGPYLAATERCTSDGDIEGSDDLVACLGHHSRSFPSAEPAFGLRMGGSR